MSAGKPKSQKQQVEEQMIDIRKFDPDSMRQHKIVLIIGPQYSGKSWLLKDLLYWINPSFPVLVNPNEFATGFFGSVLLKQCKKQTLDNNWLEQFCGRQRYLLDFNKQNHRNLDCGAALIMDHFTGDLTTQLKWHLNPNFKFLFQSGKDACTTLVVTSPFPLKLPPHYLASVDYVFMLRDTNKTNKKKLFTDFGGMFGTFENFEDIYDDCTHNYRALVIDRTVRRPKDITDQVFWYRAPRDPRRFRVGSPKLWKMCYNTPVTLEELLTKPLMLYEAETSGSGSSRSARREEQLERARRSRNPYSGAVVASAPPRSSSSRRAPPSSHQSFYGPPSF